MVAWGLTAGTFTGDAPDFASVVADSATVVTVTCSTAAAEVSFLESDGDFFTGALRFLTGRFGEGVATTRFLEGFAVAVDAFAAAVFGFFAVFEVPIAPTSK